MRKFTVEITESTDIVATLGRLKGDCLSHTTSQDGLEGFLHQAETVIHNFTDRGKEVAAIGGQFRASRTLKNPDYKIVINAVFGCGPPSLLGKLRSLFTRR
ncbi:MAG: hypothetical protein KAV00_03610 [Phycisphaerae bacterium]|nr:hypothetical protein [Phycisphaerae bacterium]